MKINFQMKPNLILIGLVTFFDVKQSDFGNTLSIILQLNAKMCEEMAKIQLYNIRYNFEIN